MVITDSNQIGVLEVAVQFDLTGVSPVINLTNQTTPNQNVSPIPDLSTLIWVLNIYSPTGTPIFQSDFDSPWKDSGDGDWTTAAITAAWPRPFGQIEWSDYKVLFQVKDIDGNIYELDKDKDLCRPTGNTPTSNNTFGVVDLSVETLCDKAQLYIKDNTSKSYQGITGTIVSSSLAVDYPRDPTGVRPAPFEITSFNTSALVPFTFNAQGYEATYFAIYTYDLGDNVSVLIRYTGQAVFAVECNIDLCGLACEVKSFEDKIKSGNCADVEAAQKKLNLITPMLLRAFIAQRNPTCGIDLPALIQEIKDEGDFSCDCGTATSGIGASSVVVDGLLFDVVSEGGDITGRFEVTGNNVVLYVKDRSYTFGSQGPCTVSTTNNIMLVPFVGTNNTHVCLQVNIAGVAAEIYTATAADSMLRNQINALIDHPNSNFIVDGKCIYSNGTCDYIYTLSNMGVNPAINYLWGIFVNGVFTSLNYNFTLGALATLETYLNTLGIGTFVVANIGGDQITISTSGNAFNLGDLIYAGNPYVKTKAQILKNCASSGPVSGSVIIQAIIDWCCSLTDNSVAIYQDYTICWIDPTTLMRTETTIAAGEKLTDFLLTLVEKGCSTIEYIMGLNRLSCTTLQDIFAPNAAAVIQANDVVMGTKNGACSQFGPVELGTQILKYGITNPDFMAALGIAIELNAGGKMCTPYSIFNISSVEHSPADNLLDLTVTFTNDDSISSLIRYARIDQGGVFNWSVPVSVLPGASPYTFADLDDGQYRVGITPVYADGRKCSEITKDTAVCGTINAFSAALNSGDIEVTYSATSPKVKVSVVYPNGGSASYIYTSGDPVSITPPANLVGLFYVTMQPVCNETTSWLGLATAPVILEVTPTANSSVVNNFSEILSNVLVTAYNISGSSLVLSASSIATGGAIAEFYLADGFYSMITIVCDIPTSSPVISYELVTGSGTYPISGTAFSNVTVAGGIVINVS